MSHPNNYDLEYHARCKRWCEAHNVILIGSNLNAGCVFCRRIGEKDYDTYQYEIPNEVIESWEKIVLK